MCKNASNSSLFLSIPAEVWTDVLKLFSRRNLVQNIAPACFRLKEICDKNVKSIHVIKNADQFTDKLEADDPDAINQLENLAANKCQLGGQFRLMSTFGVSDEKTKHVLRHSLDLLQGCRLSFDINEQSANDKMAFLDECLGILQSANKPVTIQIDQEEVLEPDGIFWLHPTVQKCSRIMLNIWPEPPNANPLRTYVAISHWLHHWPMDCDGAAADQQVRCMIVWCADPNHIDWLLGRCSKDIQQGRAPADRRPFVLSFECWDWDWPGFDQFRRIENKSTGEVLTIERKVLANGHPTHCYRLRRCLIEEEANEAMFYAEMFKQGYVADVFNIGVEKPVVTII